MLADIFDPVNRAIAVSIFAGSTFIGPVAGPVVGGFITMSYLGWRWTEYITAIMAFFLGTLGFLIVPETIEPVLLKRRAQRLRHETQNWALHAKSEENPVDLKLIAHNYILRPFIMLTLEPILVLITLYMGFIYGFLYLCFEAYPVSFEEERGWNMGVGELPFIAVTVGVLAGCVIIIAFTKARFQRIVQQTGKVVPEERLIPMMIGGILLPAGMFWFGWTSSPNITWVPQVIAGGFLGAGVLLIFLQASQLSTVLSPVLMGRASNRVSIISSTVTPLTRTLPLQPTPSFDLCWERDSLCLHCLWYVFSQRAYITPRYTDIG